MCFEMAKFFERHTYRKSTCTQKQTNWPTKRTQWIFAFCFSTARFVVCLCSLLLFTVVVFLGDGVADSPRPPPPPPTPPPSSWQCVGWMVEVCILLTSLFIGIPANNSHCLCVCVCECECVCVCVWVCVCVRIMLCVNCFGRTLLYMCITIIFRLICIMWVLRALMSAW